MELTVMATWKECVRMYASGSRILFRVVGVLRSTVSVANRLKNPVFSEIRLGES